MQLSKEVEIKKLFECRTNYLAELFDSFTYPWELVSEIGGYIGKLLANGIDGFDVLKKGVLIGKNVVIYPGVTIEAPAIIGHGTVLRPGAFLRGNVVCGSDCVIGNSSELKNCILLDNVQVPHYNYVGDSILGNHAHLGAGAICSNLKSDGKNVVVRSDTVYSTGLRKLGAILADNADIGCGCVLNPGTVVGRNTSVYPLTAMRGVYPSDSIVKSADTIVKRKKDCM